LTRLARELAATAVLVDVEGDALVVYASGLDRAHSARVASLVLDDAGAGARDYADWLARNSHYSPMLRFVLTDEDERLYTVERWCYLGSIDHWIHLNHGQPLERLAGSYLPHVGNESFFELM
jgi:hypothetical protein